MATVDFQHILAAARQLSKSSQAKLVSALLQEPEAVHTPALEPLSGLSKAELGSLTASVFAPAYARCLQQLLRLHREKKLKRALLSELDALAEALRFNRPTIILLRRYWRATGVQFGE